MSKQNRPAKSEPTSITERASTTTLSNKDEAALQSINDAVSRIRRNIPESPYILTVPINSSNEYHHHTKQAAESWRNHTPFEPHEEHLQYMTFVLRDNIDSCFVVRTVAEEERDKRIRSSITAGSSGGTTPRSTGPKKKISLADWTNKTAAGRSSKPAANKATSSQANDFAASDQARPSNQSQQAPINRTTKLNSFKDNEPEHQSPNMNAGHTQSGKGSSMPPKKKLKLSPSPDSNRDIPHGLPALQSPIRVDKAPHDLPPMLSPTLPRDIEDELSRLTRGSTETVNNFPAEQTEQSKPKPLHHSSKPAKETAHTSSGRRSASGADGHLTGQFADKSLNAQRGNDRMRPNDRPEDSDGTVDKHSIVKLKYGRTLRKRIENLLKLPSRPANKLRPDNLSQQSLTNPGDERSSSFAGKRMPERTSDSAGQTSEKRKRVREGIDPQQQSVSRNKSSSEHDSSMRPTTPLKHTNVSPLPDAHSTRTQGLKAPATETPRKEFLAVQMARSRSTESNGNTPQMNGGTPLGSRPTSAPNTKGPDATRWASYGEKYSIMGRKLKYEFQDLMSRKGVSELDRKRAAISGIQSLLCYMIYFFCQEMSARLEHLAPGLTNTWMMCIPLWLQYHRGLTAFPQLEGLHYHIGLVIRNRISQIIGERMKTNAKNEAASEREVRNGHADAPTPTPSVSSSSNPLANLPSVDAIGQNLIEMHRYAVQGNTKLSVQDLLKSFPKSWAAQSINRSTTATLEKSPEHLLQGSWFLPIGMDTTAIQGARAAVKLLEEWVENNAKGLELEILKV